MVRQINAPAKTIREKQFNARAIASVRNRDIKNFQRHHTKPAASTITCDMLLNLVWNTERDESEQEGKKTTNPNRRCYQTRIKWNNINTYSRMSRKVEGK